MTNNQGYYSNSLRNRSNKGSFLEKTLFFLITAFLVQLVLPWWVMPLVIFVIAIFLYQKKGSSFFAAFLAVFLFWSIYAFAIDWRNNHILSSKVILLFPLPSSSFILVLLTGIVGGLIAGLAAMAGRQLGMLFFTKKNFN